MFHGSIVALATPMLEDGAVDWDALADLVDFHLEQGTDAIVAVGTSGESATLDHDEHRQVIRFVVDQVHNRIPVIAGTGSNSTRETLELTRHAREVGADAALLVAPYYNKPTQEGLYQHFRRVADEVHLPQILYNVPGRTGCQIAVETVERLSHLSTVVAIKDATGDIARAQDLVRGCGERMDVLSGEDGIALPIMLAGGKGVISVTANVAPARMAEMCHAALAGELARARSLDDDLAPLHHALFLEANPIPVKWALHEMGRMGPGIRLPLTPLSEVHRIEVRQALEKLGLVGA
ncbi:dihydrodipicolinate synthase [Thiohalorhabdus denitrificans]|uniref:4-hydroxy-tetrahydrodipicolinate synthase n=1 Tax=Thiohalorhabdus denitrificans TaxID=381306 RepID=A0A0P9C2H5_9GAMM|nr:4-hydroxy-tetrahydrodipicolinate synthase [Thiohalorhabdus denitrificans]KPV39138.1 dihydrodipicolinate synthase [Thiohalorhabdus denitrificans]SCX76664.1 4-hydroxy-tetrahydrodipicolinate synthase [Thiohalorhabdus denitrificans]